MCEDFWSSSGYKKKDNITYDALLDELESYYKKREEKVYG
jgi:hypothetical protein